jgi:hypothetical protein
MRPQPCDYAPYYQRYIELAFGDNLLEAFEIADPALFKYLESIPAEKGSHAYASGKWTVKQLLQHMIDTERVFAYRATCFARGETISLPGFDENIYANNGTAAHRQVHELVTEFKLLRASTVAMFKGFTAEEQKAKGVASNNGITVLTLGYIIIGHANHHVNVLKERYLIQGIA